MKMFVLLTALFCLTAKVVAGPCDASACEPPLGNLLTGRSAQFKASSQTPDHMASNLIPSTGTTDLYFESEENVTSVSLTLDLEASMYLESIKIDFLNAEDKPDGIVIERSKNYGNRYRSYHYLARDCEDVFYMTPEQRKNAKDVVCETMDASSKSLAFKVIPEGGNSAQADQEFMSSITNIRINFTEFGRRSGRRSYRVSKLHVLGSCFCSGHASECETSPSGEGKILPTCKCQHNTKGMNCEECQDLYNDVHWKSGWKNEANECKKCNCSGRADSCFFDPQVFETSGNKSGGVCLSCKNSTGFSCQKCRSFYYADSNACRPCDCSDEGSLTNLCDSVTGQCDCRSRFTGRDCRQSAQG